jgi:hypothetical protein
VVVAGLGKMVRLKHSSVSVSSEGLLISFPVGFSHNANARPAVTQIKMFKKSLA